MSDTRTVFADGILEASVTHGVVRITLAQAGSDGKAQAAGQLIMPLVQLPAFANGLLGLLRQVESKMKEAQQGGDPTAQARVASALSAGGEAPAPSVGGAFRFGS
ncbi:MAG: hypothetical protein K2X49_30320 [Acetobacteraceae bacterium]|nr:hypothetical protein [Acetobacteraceae bacterium]